MTKSSSLSTQNEHILNTCTLGDLRLSANAVNSMFLLGTLYRCSTKIKKGVGERDVELRFGEVTIKPGEYLYADADGVVVADGRLD